MKKAFIYLLILFIVLLLIGLALHQFQRAILFPYIISDSLFFVVACLNLLLMKWGVEQDNNTFFLGSFGTSLFLKILLAVLVFSLIKKHYGYDKVFTIYHFLSYIIYSLVGAIMIPTKKEIADK